MLFIGICGASGSGKTTLADELAKMVHKSILIINQDAYYYDHPDMSFEERCLLNYDEPSIFDHDLLLEDVRALLSGKRVLNARQIASRICAQLHAMRHFSLEREHHMLCKRFIFKRHRKAAITAQRHRFA